MMNLDDFKRDCEIAIASEMTFLIDHGSRTSDEIAEDIIEIARNYGFFAYDEKTFQERLPDKDDDQYSECLTYLMDEAIEYLSNGVPDGYWIGNDGYAGGFGIWKCEDD
jgi:hypothetical protein